MLSLMQHSARKTLHNLYTALATVQWFLLIHESLLLLKIRGNTQIPLQAQLNCHMAYSGPHQTNHWSLLVLVVLRSIQVQII